jgi:phosphatidylserine decarboxylase
MTTVAVAVLVVGGLALAGLLFWRYLWFFRNPRRIPPVGENIVSPADGTVVYVKQVPPDQSVISIKRGVRASINDIVRADLASPKVLIGVFMSPFNVHYNRAPLAGEVQFIRHTPALGSNLCMGAMHLRTFLKQAPFSENSVHILQNERTVTRIAGSYKGDALHCYVIQIAARSVRGIESLVRVGERVEKGAVFGMIRIGSQVDLVVPWRASMRVTVRPGQKVRAGETILID